MDHLFEYVELQIGDRLDVTPKELLLGLRHFWLPQLLELNRLSVCRQHWTSRAARHRVARTIAAATGPWPLDVGRAPYGAGPCAPARAICRRAAPVRSPHDSCTP